MNLLITNDDGIYSPGILAPGPGRAEVRSRPHRRARRRAVGDERGDYRRRARCCTGKTPLGDFEAFRVNGTPSDCVALGTHLWERVDVVLSGHQPRDRTSATASGIRGRSRPRARARCSAAAALRSARRSTDEEPRFDTLEPFVERALELLLPDTSMRLVNVNLPQQPAASPGRACRSASTTAGSCRARIRSAATTTGSRSSRSSRPTRARIAGRSSTTSCR